MESLRTGGGLPRGRDAADIVLALLPDPAEKRREVYRLNDWLIEREMTVKTLAKEHKARCLVIDPVSTLPKAGNELTAHGVAERLIDWSKSDGITLVCTSLLDEMSSQSNGGTPLQISTLADTWIHLNYLVQAGERNRGMSIIKSRGTAHSNQDVPLLKPATSLAA